MSYDEYMAAATDEAVAIEAYVQAKQSYYAEQGTATVYLQDQDGGYFAYDMACTQEEYDQMTEGTKIRVSGYKAEWSGEIEIMDGKLEEIIAGDTFVAEPLDVTAMLGTDELAAHQNEKVVFTGLTVAASTDANGNEAPPSCTTMTAPAPTATTCTSTSTTTARPTPSPSRATCATTPPTSTTPWKRSRSARPSTAKASCTGMRASTPTSPA